MWREPSHHGCGSPPRSISGSSGILAPPCSCRALARTKSHQLCVHIPPRGSHTAQKAERLLPGPTLSRVAVTPGRCSATTRLLVSGKPDGEKAGCPECQCGSDAGSPHLVHTDPSRPCQGLTAMTNGSLSGCYHLMRPVEQLRVTPHCTGAAAAATGVRRCRHPCLHASPLTALGETLQGSMYGKDHLCPQWHWATAS